MAKWLKNPLFYLLLIIFIGGFLRFYALDRADVLTDEASITLRSIGYFDWLATPYQTTPLEWTNNREWWTFLSFHDHPFFGFWLQYIQFKITGVSIWTMRFWPALYGVLSIFLIYLIGKKLFNEKIGLLSAVILATNNLHIWVSRLAIQESFVILLSILSFWLFLKSLENKKYFYGLGLVAGIAIASKLTTIIIWPIIITYLIFFEKKYFKEKELYFSLFITFLFTTPYILYNYFLYKKFGHFDFQLSHLLNQNVTAWQIRPGREEIPETIYAFKFMFLGIKKAVSSIDLYLYLASLITGIIYFIKNKFNNISKSYFFIAIITIFHILLYVLIGSGTRFLSMIIPWLAITLALFIYNIIKNDVIRNIFIFVLLCWQIFFSFQTNISYKYEGIGGITYAEIKSQVYGYGYNELSKYIDNLLSNKKTTVILPVNNQNIQNFINQQVDKQNGFSESLLIVFDSRMYGETVVWGLTRHFLYEGWPVLPFETYNQALEINGNDLFIKLGVQDTYYILATDNIIRESSYEPSINQKHNIFLGKIKDTGTLVKTIYDHNGKDIFEIYKF